MSVLFIVLPLAIVLAGLALAAFIIAAKQGQYDDLDSPQWRMLFSDSDRNGK
jgi:cbb3-type cytochrome oxidase maturation protein